MPYRNEITDIAEELCRKYPNQPARSLAKTLVEKSNKAITIESARAIVRRIFGQSGKVHRKYTKVKRPARKPGTRIQMPKSKAEEWIPFQLPITSGKLGIISDMHIPFHSEVALDAAVSHLKQEKIKCLLINGDGLDFYSLSRWEKRPSKRNFPAELKEGRLLLQWLRQEFPKIPIIYKLGNHEERWEKWLWEHAPEISEEPEMGFESWLHCDKYKIEVVGDQRIIMVGNLPVLHGHELGRSVFNPVNPARGAYLRAQHTILISHHHQTSGHADTNLFHHETFVWSIGCLCELTPTYMKVNRHNHGFAVVELMKNGDFNVSNLRVLKNGKVRA